MSGKKNTQGTSTSGTLPALKIGSRVRGTDDGVTGRVAWANAVRVKIKWDDGEEVTWKRESLAERPIEILDADDATESVAAAEQVRLQEIIKGGPQPIQFLFRHGSGLLAGLLLFYVFSYPLSVSHSAVPLRPGRDSRPDRPRTTLRRSAAVMPWSRPAASCGPWPQT